MPPLAAAPAVVGGTAAAGGISAATVATYAAVAAAGVTAYSTIQQGKYQQQMAEYNAALAEREAETIEEASEFEEREARREGRKLKARQFMQFAKGGVVPTTGTPLLVREETEGEIERSIRLKKYGFGLQYSRALSDAKMQRMIGKSRSRASRWSAGTSLLTGAYRVASIRP